jgi:DNA modification methylase
MSETKVKDSYQGKNFMAYNGDSCEIMPMLPTESIDFSVFSPPFSSLYTYSNSDRDLGNCKTDDEFYIHFEFIVKELYRMMKPGREVCIHCMNIPTSKEKDGYIGLKDFRGDIIRLFQKCGFIYHSEITIWKDPVTQMQRTKALGLLHKQIKKDSSMSRQGLPDYVVVMRKPGENPNRITHTNENFPVSQWQNYASPVWDEVNSPVWWDINQSDTLNGKTARENDDERHICPLQLPVIERCLTLWSKENDVVFTPFLGIGSEIYQALKMNRRGIGIELKESYYKCAVENCKDAEIPDMQMTIDEWLKQ